MTEIREREMEPRDGMSDAIRVAFGGRGQPDALEDRVDGGGSDDGRSTIARLERRLGSVPRIRLPEALRDPAGAPAPPRSLAAPARAGRYQVEGQLAEGGVGIILQARDVDLGREVAIKIVRPGLAGASDVVQRFVEEAQIGGQLQHPGIVPVYELGLTADGLPFFAMKLVQGRTLAALLDDRTEEDAEDAAFLRTFLRVCETVAYAHARSVIHRDLKPSNVMVGAFGEVQVVDWGMAKVLRGGGIADEHTARAPEPAAGGIETIRTEGAGSHSRVGSVMGTIGYMPPEQAGGHVDLLDERADVFALGAILCEILTGHPPYVAGDEPLLLQAIRGRTEGARERLRACGWDPELVDLALRCLAVDPADRPRHAGHLADAVSRYLSSLEAKARRAEVAAARSGVRAEEERKRRRLAVALAATVVLSGLAGGGAYLLYEGHRREATARSTEAARGALGEALSLEGGARRSGPADVAAWDQARVAARQASRAAPDAEASVREEIGATLLRVDAGRSEATAAARRAQRDRETATRLEELRLLRGDALVPAKVLAGYRAAFEAYGLRIECASDQDAAAILHESAICDLLCTALDDWSLALDRYSEETPTGSAHLLRIADLADPDPWRRQVRAAFMKGDAAGLERILEAVVPASHEVASLTFAAEALAARTTPERGVDFLRRVHAFHPGDFWVNYLLATWLDEPATSAAAGGSPRPPTSAEAIGYYRAAQALRPSSREVRHQLGCALETAGEWQAAAEAWRAALEISPEYHHAWSHLYSALQHTDGLDAEVETLRKARDAGGATAAVWTRLGIALRILGKPSESIEAFEHAVELDPNLAQARVGLGMQQILGGRNHDAARTYAALVPLDPGDVNAWRQLAFARDRIGDRLGAVAAHEGALRAAPFAVRSHVDLVGALSRANRLDEALTAYQDLRARFVGRLEVAELESQLAAALVAAGRAGEAQPLAERARAGFESRLAAHPDDARAQVGLGAVLCDRFQEYDRALELFAKADGDREQGRAALIFRGIAYREKGDFDAALAAFETLSDRYPESPGGLLYVAELRLLEGRTGEALEVLERGAQRFPRTARVHRLAAWCHQVAGRPEKALPHLRTVLSLVPDHEWASYQAGVLCLAAGLEEEGLLHLRHHREAAPWSPGLAPTASAWDDTCHRLARLGKSLDEVRRGTLPSNDLEDVCLAGAMCWEIGDPRAAARFFERSLREDRGAAPLLLPYHTPWLVEEAAGLVDMALATLGPIEATPSEADRRAWRQASVAHLRASIAIWERRLEERDPAFGPVQALETAGRIRGWPSLAEVRGAAQIARLPEDERGAWRDFWVAVEGLERRAGGRR